MTPAVETALATLEKGLEEFGSSETWVAWLNKQSKFHKYSFSNVILILMIMPDARKVASYKTWKQVGRQVIKGEKAIRILAPSFKKDQDTGEQVLVGFRAVPVFDISQTEGEPLQGSVELVGADDELLARMKRVAMDRGIIIQEVKSIGGANSSANFAQNKIELLSRLDSIMKTRTLVHELAHLTLKHLPTNDRQEIEIMEIEAESVAYVVMHALGIDAGKYSFAYLKSYAGGKDRLQKLGNRIAKTAKSILADYED